MKNVYLWVYVCMYVYKAVLSVSTRKGTDIWEFEKHRQYKSINDVAEVCLWACACIQTATQSVGTRKDTNIYVRPTWVHI